jgi:hypothetical protein
MSLRWTSFVFFVREPLVITACACTVIHHRNINDQQVLMTSYDDPQWAGNNDASVGDKLVITCFISVSTDGAVFSSTGRMFLRPEVPKNFSCTPHLFRFG